MYWRRIGRSGMGELVVKDGGRDSMWDQVR